VSEITVDTLGTAEALTGRLAEYQELLDVVSQRPGLTVISADPWSGTSGLLATAYQPLSPMALVDARRAADTLDLAMAIADAAVMSFAPQASSWWTYAASPANVDGMRIARSVSEYGVDLDALRLGSGNALARLRDAITLTVSIANEKPLLTIDHFGELLAAIGGAETRKLLSELRTARQEHADLDILLVEHPGGPIERALRSREHPLYQAGHVLRFRRPEPQRFINDLVITRGVTDVAIDLLGAAAELASGVPGLTWRIIELAPDDETSNGQSRAYLGWQALRRATEPAYAHMWDMLRRIHGSAQAVVAAMSVGLGPYETPLADKTVHDCLNRLRDVGLVWQPRKRQWTISDPLLSAWAKEHGPSWTLHRMTDRLL